MTCGHHPEPACRAKDYRLFDSTHLDSHLAARRFCTQCPMVMDCLQQAISISGEISGETAVRGPHGTWGGLLWRQGLIIPVQPPSALETTKVILKGRAA